VEIDRQLRLVPDDPPSAHQAVQVVVIRQPLARVRVSLVPDRAADRGGHHRAEVSIEQPTGIPVAAQVSGDRGADFLRLAALPDHRFAGGDLVFQRFAKDIPCLFVFRGRRVSLQTAQVDRLAVIILGGGCSLLPGELDGDLRPRLAPAPDRHVHPALQDGVVVEWSAEFDGKSPRPFQLGGSGKRYRIYKDEGRRGGEAEGDEIHGWLLGWFRPPVAGTETRRLPISQSYTVSLRRVFPPFSTEPSPFRVAIGATTN